MNRSLGRMSGFLLLIAIALVGIVVRLTDVQLIEGHVYAAAARANQVRQIPVAAPRGLMLDRNGKIVVRSRPSFVCALIPSEVHDVKRTIAMLAATLQIPEEKLWRRLLNHRKIHYQNFDEVVTYEPYGPVILASDLKTSQMARLAEAAADLPGVDLEEQPVRNYPMGKMGAHLFGFVGQISEDEYRDLRGKGYSPNDVIGKDGLEDTYDHWLRGTTGGQQVVVNASGGVVGRLKPVQSKPGNVLVLTIDKKVQEYAEHALTSQLKKWGKARGNQRLSGAVVALDPWTGGVLAMASAPSFDPNDFATPISDAKYTGYLTDKLRPLYDRAIGAATPTGSTFKMVTGSAAISSGAIKPNQVLYDSGSWNCHGVTFRDIAAGGLGSTDFVRALAASSDGYFYQLGYRLGHERLRKFALAYGLNSKSGIDIPGEYAGNWPTEEWTQRTFGKEYHLEPSDVCQLAIGQGAMQATPLQMANVVAAVVNGGTLFRPHVVHEIRSPSGRLLKRFDHEIIRHVPVTREALREVKMGMSKVTAAGGTGYGLAIEGIPFGGKTGTAETDGGHGPNTTWFVAFAPVAHPTIAIAVFMERTGGYGASVAGPVAREIIGRYFNKKIE